MKCRMKKYRIGRNNEFMRRRFRPIRLMTISPFFLSTLYIFIQQKMNEKYYSDSSGIKYCAYALL